MIHPLLQILQATSQTNMRNIFFSYFFHAILKTHLPPDTPKMEFPLPIIPYEPPAKYPQSLLLFFESAENVHHSQLLLDYPKHV